MDWFLDNLAFIWGGYFLVLLVTIIIAHRQMMSSDFLTGYDVDVETRRRNNENAAIAAVVVMTCVL